MWHLACRSGIALLLGACKHDNPIAQIQNRLVRHPDRGAVGCAGLCRATAGYASAADAGRHRHCGGGANPAACYNAAYFAEMNDIIENVVPSREQIDRLQAEMIKLPQAELVTEHYFSPGMYCRKVTRPAGTLIVGKVHKEPHFFMCTKGEILAWSETGMRRLQAGDVIESKPGTKRVTMAIVDSIGMTVHKTDKTDLDEIEAELIEPDEIALFDATNKLSKNLHILEGN